MIIWLLVLVLHFTSDIGSLTAYFNLDGFDFFLFSFSRHAKSISTYNSETEGAIFYKALDWIRG